MVLKHVVLTADALTANGRTYPINVLKSMVKKEKHKIKAGLSFGTYKSDVSHKINDLVLNGNDLVCEAEVLETPSGLELKKDIEAGASVSIKPLGFGRVDSNGKVLNGYQLISFNIE